MPSAIPRQTVPQDAAEHDSKQLLNLIFLYENTLTRMHMSPGVRRRGRTATGEEVGCPYLKAGKPRSSWAPGQSWVSPAGPWVLCEQHCGVFVITQSLAVTASAWAQTSSGLSAHRPMAEVFPLRIGTLLTQGTSHREQSSVHTTVMTPG